MRLKEAARTSAFVLKFRAEKPGDPGPWALSPLKPPSLSENASQSVLFPTSFIGEVGRNDSALLFRSSSSTPFPAHSLQEVHLHRTRTRGFPWSGLAFLVPLTV